MRPSRAETARSLTIRKIARRRPAAWRLVRDREGLRDYEREALASYARAVGLDDETCRASELMYPVLVAAMAEKNWEYSRPRWLHKQFGL